LADADFVSRVRILFPGDQLFREVRNCAELLFPGKLAVLFLLSAVVGLARGRIRV
jgi:hypothetical protein